MIILPEAEADLSEAQEWYDQQRMGLGADLLQCVEETLRRIDQLPEMHGIVHKDVRRAVVRRFPYVVYYRVVAGEATVVAIMHSRRNPQDWQSRI